MNAVAGQPHYITLNKAPEVYDGKFTLIPAAGMLIVFNSTELTYGTDFEVACEGNNMPSS